MLASNEENNNETLTNQEEPLNLSTAQVCSHEQNKIVIEPLDLSKSCSELF